MSIVMTGNEEITIKRIDLIEMAKIANRQIPALEDVIEQLQDIIVCFDRVMEIADLEGVTAAEISETVITTTEGE